MCSVRIGNLYAEVKYCCFLFSGMLNVIITRVNNTYSYNILPTQLML